MYAALAGTCAALGSVFGKLALEGSTLATSLTFLLEDLVGLHFGSTFEAVRHIPSLESIL